MSASPKVVSLTGAILPGESARPVVDLLASLLEEAKRGEITDIAIAMVSPNGNICCAVAHSGLPHAHHLCAAALYLLRRCERNSGIGDG